MKRSNWFERCYFKWFLRCPTLNKIFWPKKAVSYSGFTKKLLLATQVSKRLETKEEKTFGWQVSSLCHKKKTNKSRGNMNTSSWRVRPHFVGNHPTITYWLGTRSLQKKFYYSKWPSRQYRNKIWGQFNLAKSMILLRQLSDKIIFAVLASYRANHIWQKASPSNSTLWSNRIL